MDTRALQQISGNADVSVQLVNVTHQDNQLTARLSIYNGQPDALTFTPDDIWLALGYVPDPPGPRTPALMFEPFTLQPEQAIDLTIVWYWAGEPYAAL